MNESQEAKGIVIRELEPALWPDLEGLFGSNGACGGCWCWWWRLAGVEHWKDVQGDVAHERLHRAVVGGAAHGVLAFDGAAAVGWCSYEPRIAFPRLQRSPTFKGTPTEGVWFVGCFFVERSWRRRGVAELLLDAALAAMARDGACAIEACPTDTHGEKRPDTFVYMGTRSMFERRGFCIVPHKGKGMTVMRRELRSEERAEWK